METNPRIGSVAALIGEPARAAILVSLWDGRALSAGELAARAEVSTATASAHLAKLVAGGLLAVEARGRHRFYRLAGGAVAEAMEALAVLAPPGERIAAPDPFEREALAELRFARTCYDHLAGWLGVAIAEAMLARRFLIEAGDGFAPTASGEAWLAALGVDVAAARRARRAFARGCLDWSERRPHLAGALGAALAVRLFALGWVERVAGERTVRLTGTGRGALRRELGVRAGEADGAVLSGAERPRAGV